MSDSFQALRPSSMRASSRLACSSGLTSSQYFRRIDPVVDDRFLDPGNHLQKLLGLALGAEPHHPLNAGPIVPAAVKDDDLARRWQMRNVALGVHLRFFALGGRRQPTTRKMRGLTRSVIASIVPPLPAPSRPSKTMQTLRPLSTTHCWSLTNSMRKRVSSRSYSFRFSLPSASWTSLLASDIGLSSNSHPQLRMHREIRLMIQIKAGP
jgi:hypothetical protein